MDKLQGSCHPAVLPGLGTHHPALLLLTVHPRLLQCLRLLMTLPAVALARDCRGELQARMGRPLHLAVLRPAFLLCPWSPANWCCPQRAEGSSLC